MSRISTMVSLLNDMSKEDISVIVSILNWAGYIKKEIEFSSEERKLIWDLVRKDVDRKSCRSSCCCKGNIQKSILNKMMADRK